MTSFAESWEYQELLGISKSHLDALDMNRVSDEAILGTDNLATLKVSSVFAGISIEAAINDFLITHVLLIENHYLQDFFEDVLASSNRSMPSKIDFINKLCPGQFSKSIVEEAKKLFVIRNKITHEKREFIPAAINPNGNSSVKSKSLTNDEMQHMRRHYHIAFDLLSRFWLPAGWPNENKSQEN